MAPESPVPGTASDRHIPASRLEIAAGLLKNVDRAPERDQMRRLAIAGSIDQRDTALDLGSLIEPTRVVDAAMMPRILATFRSVDRDEARPFVSQLLSQVCPQSYPRPTDFLIDLATAASDAVIGETLGQVVLLRIHRAIHGNLPAEGAAALLAKLIEDAGLTTAPGEMLIAAATACRGNQCSPADKERLRAAISDRALAEVDAGDMNGSELIDVYAAIHPRLRHHAVLQKLIDDAGSTEDAYVAFTAATEACDGHHAAADNVQALTAIANKAFGSAALKDAKDDLTKILRTVLRQLPRDASPLPVLRTLVPSLLQTQEPDRRLMYRLLDVLEPVDGDEARSLRETLLQRIRTGQAPASFAG